MAFERTSVKIPSATPGWNLDAWKYIPTREGSQRPGHPMIILAHGLSANKLLSLDVYAAGYAAEGYACVVFDYRRWGASDGSPRHVLRVSEQLEDYRTVIYWTRQAPEFDKKKIIIWGTSFSGGHVMQLASEDLDIAAALSQCPYAGSAPSNPSPGRSLTALGHLLKLVSFAVADALRQSLGVRPLYCAAASDPGKGGILAMPGALESLVSLGKDPSHFPNELNASCIFQIIPYNPHLQAASITCPILLVISKDDAICSVSGALKAGTDAEQSEVVSTEGGHFDVYPGYPEFAKALHAQLEFLRKYVPV